MTPIFSGLSLVIHLLIILLAKIFNFILGKDKNTTFFVFGAGKLYAKGSVVSKLLSSFALIFVAVYVTVAGGFIIATSLHVGQDEPQVVLFKQTMSFVGLGITDSLRASDLFAAERGKIFSYGHVYDADVHANELMVLSCGL
jgi:hypothetical protein